MPGMNTGDPVGSSWGFNYNLFHNKYKLKTIDHNNHNQFLIIIHNIT